MIGFVASRAVVFGVGVGAGVYATVKARRAAYRLSAPGIADQAATLRLGWQEFRKEFDHGHQEKRVEQLRRIDAPNLTLIHSAPDDELPELEEA